jgi:hypothetical protein
VSSVASDDHSSGGGVGSVIEEIGGEPGADAPNQGAIHTIGSGPDQASQTGRPELQPRTEEVQERGIVLRVEEGLDIGSRRRIGIFLGP